MINDILTFLQAKTISFSTPWTVQKEEKLASVAYTDQVYTQVLIVNFCSVQKYFISFIQHDIENNVILKQNLLGHWPWSDNHSTK